MFLQGVLANRSGWKQRKRHDVVAPASDPVLDHFRCFEVDPIPDISWNFWDKTVRKDLIEADFSRKSRSLPAGVSALTFPVLFIVHLFHPVTC